MSQNGILAQESGYPLRLRNIVASAAVVGLACGIYMLVPYNGAQMRNVHRIYSLTFTGAGFLLSAVESLMTPPFVQVFGVAEVSFVT